MTGQYAELKKRINDADAVVIGASNGLSMADGYNIFANDAWFQKNFGDLQRRYGIRSVLEGAFYPYQTLEEKWGFSSRLASKVHFDAAPGYAMRRLRDIQDVFVLTTNADDSFELAGFAPEQVFALEGGRVEMRCSAHCSNEVVKDLDAMERMAAAETNGRIPSELIPRCRHCGAPMEPNLADSDVFFSLALLAGESAGVLRLCRQAFGREHRCHGDRGGSAQPDAAAADPVARGR